MDILNDNEALLGKCTDKREKKLVSDFLALWEKKKMAYKQELWDEAKKRCHIGDEEIRMAKEMGLNPKSLIKISPTRVSSGKPP